MSTAIAVESVLPHAAPMILIDEAVRTGDAAAESTVHVTEDAMFYDAEAGGVPSYVGIEYIAQTVAAHAGAAAVANGDPVRVGFLLGTLERAFRIRRCAPSPNPMRFDSVAGLVGAEKSR